MLEREDGLQLNGIGLNKVPVIILDIDDEKSSEIAIIENVQRQDLNIIEEAKGYQRLIQEFGYDHEKIAKFMSKSRSHVSNTLRLLNLPKDIVGLLEEGKLTAGQEDLSYWLTERIRNCRKYC